MAMLSRLRQSSRRLPAFASQLRTTSTEATSPSIVNSPISQNVVETLHDKSMSSSKRIELVQTYLSQDVQEMKTQDVAAMSIMLEDILLDPDTPNAIKMMELINKHKIVLTNRSTKLFARMYARYIVEMQESTPLSAHVNWLLDNTYSQFPKIPLRKIYTELITRGHVDIAIKLWHECMELDEDRSKHIPHLAAVDSLAEELNRYQQYHQVLSIASGPYSAQVWTSDPFIACVVAAHFHRRQLDEIFDIEASIAKRRIPIHLPAYYLILKKAKALRGQPSSS